MFKPAIAFLLLHCLWHSAGLAQNLPLLSTKPIIDGKRDAFLSSLTPRKFNETFTFDNEYLDDNATATFNLAVHQDGLYLLIETNASAISYHKRGFLYGDGYKLVVGVPAPLGYSTEYFEAVYSPTQKTEDKPYRQYLAAYNLKNVGLKLSDASQSAEAVMKSGTSFEAFLAWQDILPFHPALMDSIGINVYFAKGMQSKQGDYVTKGFAIAKDEGIWDESQQFRVLRSFEITKDASFQHAFSAAFALSNSTVMRGQPLRLIYPFPVSTRDFHSLTISTAKGDEVTDKLSLVLENKPSQIPTANLAPGDYFLTLSISGHHFTQPFTVMPNFSIEQRYAELVGSGDMGQLERETLAFNIQRYRQASKNVKAYEKGAQLLTMLQELDDLIGKLESGEALFNDGDTVYRVAFRSALDGSLQPYSLKLPVGYSTKKQYPLLVFLHGSGQDEQKLLDKERGNGKFIELAPLGRDIYSAYAYQHSHIDVEEAIEHASKHFTIDVDNIVIGGFSMGGYGALKMFYESPSRYKGVAVFAGHPNLANQWMGTDIYPDFTKRKPLKRFKDVPVFLYHGSADPALSFTLAEQLAKNLEDEGAEVTTAFIENRGHVYQDAASHKRFSKWLDSTVKGH
jgi:predicted esterase